MPTHQNNFPPTLIKCVGIKCDVIIKSCLCQSSIFKELSLPVTNRKVLVSLQIYLPAQVWWTCSPRLLDTLCLAINEGVIYCYSDVSCTPSLNQLIQRVIPHFLLGGGEPLPGLLAYQQQLELCQAVTSISVTPKSITSASKSVSSQFAPVISSVRVATVPTLRKAHCKNCAITLSPIPTGCCPHQQHSPSEISSSNCIVSSAEDHCLPHNTGNYAQHAMEISEVIDLSEDVDDHDNAVVTTPDAVDASEVINISDNADDHVDFMNHTACFWQV